MQNLTVAFLDFPPLFKVGKGTVEEKPSGFMEFFHFVINNKFERRNGISEGKKSKLHCKKALEERPLKPAPWSWIELVIAIFFPLHYWAVLS